MQLFLPLICIFSRRQRAQWSEAKFDHHASTPLSESRAPPLVTPMIQRRYSSPGISAPAAPQTPYACATSAGDTLFQETDHTSRVSHDSNITQHSDTDSISACHQAQHQNQQPAYLQSRPVVDRYSGAYPSPQSSHTSSSECNTKSCVLGGIQSTPHYHQMSQEHLPTAGNVIENDSSRTVTAERHLTGNSDTENTLYAGFGNMEKLQDVYFKEGNS